MIQNTRKKNLREKFRRFFSHFYDFIFLLFNYHTVLFKENIQIHILFLSYSEKHIFYSYLFIKIQEKKEIFTRTNFFKEKTLRKNYNFFYFFFEWEKWKTSVKRFSVIYDYFPQTIYLFFYIRKFSFYQKRI